MEGVLRNIAFYICIPIYTSIPKMYEIFYNMANARFFQSNDSILRQLSSNLYVLISVVMLFAFSVTLLQAIVSPDKLDDPKKGVWQLFKRMVIGIVLIVVIPFLFNYAYEVQKLVMDKSLVEKVLVGLNLNRNNGSASGNTNGGQIIAGSLLASVIYPKDEGITVASINQNIADTYEGMIVTNVEEMRKFAVDLNALPSNSTSKTDFAFEFQGLIAIIAGGITLYILLLFAIDMAIRLFQLALYELTVPISIMAYMANGNDSLIKWAKEVGKCYASVFVKIATMAVYIFFASRIDEFITRLTTVGGQQVNWVTLFRVILIVGLLIFANRMTKIIEESLGIKLTSGGGIGGRLGEMAVVGKTAKNAWDSLRKHPIQTIGKPVGAAAGTLGSIGAAVTRGWNYSRREGNGIFRSALNTVGAGVWSTLMAPSAMQRGWKTGNLSAFGNAIARDKETHPEGTTWQGRADDIITTALGLGTALDRENLRIARANPYQHNGRYYNKEQIDRLNGQYENVRNETQAVLDAVEHELDRDDSRYLQATGTGVFNFHFDDGIHEPVDQTYHANNFNEINEILEALRESGPNADDYRVGPDNHIDLDAFHEAQQRYQASVNALQNRVRQVRQQAREELVNHRNDWTHYNEAGDNTNALNAQNHINIANTYTQNAQYAPGVDINITNFATLQNANDEATRHNNDITGMINNVDAERESRKNSEQYTAMERTDKGTSARDKDNQIHGSDGSYYRGN